MDDNISRQIAQKLFGKALTYQEQQGKLTWTTSEVKQWVADFIEDLPSAKPEPHYDEWCDTCKEYNKEKHCCPRWNRVIKSTIEELKTVQPVATDTNVGDKICPNCGAKMEGDAE